jgi:hypothetical protein
MKLNQFEKSISFIHNNLPGYMRNLYEQFIMYENELYSQLKKAYETNPYSVNKYVWKIILSNRPQFIDICKYIMSRENQVILQMSMLYKNEYFVECASKSERDNDKAETILGGDITAPLIDIKGFFSSFPQSSRTNLPIICIEPKKTCIPNFSNVKEKTNKDRFWGLYQYDDIFNDTGDVSIFDNLTSVLKIDISHVFTHFFHSLLRASIPPSMDRINERAWDLYENFHLSLGNSEGEVVALREQIINNYISMVEGSAILTYMTYAGRLLGAKENMLSWLYTTFVKETVGDVEAGEYQKNADVTAFSGHQLGTDGNNVGCYPGDEYNGETTAGSTNFTRKDEIDRQKMIQNRKPSNEVAWNINLVYKHLRLNYSNWCSVINAINAASGEENKSQPVFHELFFDSTDLSNHLYIAKKILYEYISHYYATYNVYIFPTAEKAGLSSAGYFIKFISNRIFNTEIKDIIKFTCLNVFDVRCKCTERSCPHPRRITDYFINPDRVIGILNSIKLVRNILADLFMTYSYVIMLNGLYNKQDSILNEKDFLTGRSKKELFLEIYNGLLNKIRDFFGNNREWRYIDIIVYSARDIEANELSVGLYGNYEKHLKVVFTPLREYYFSRYNKELVEDVSIIRDILDHLKSPIVLDHSDIGYVTEYNINEKYSTLIKSLYDIHPISVIAELSDCYKKNSGSLHIDHDKIITGSPSSSYTRSGYLFPRNRITNDMINSARLYEPKLFTSLEDASSILEKAKEDSMLGNNGNYSFIGGIGGSVTDEENTVDKLNQSMIPSDNNVMFNSRESFSVLRDRNIRAAAVDRLVNQWIDLFRTCVLGGEEIKMI